jgi:hypothetical protein
MRITNIRDVKQSGGYTHATVDATTGIWWWKKTEARKVFKPSYSIFWYFSDDGCFTPGFIVERLHVAHMAAMCEKGVK